MLLNIILPPSGCDVPEGSHEEEALEGGQREVHGVRHPLYIRSEHGQAHEDESYGPGLFSFKNEFLTLPIFKSSIMSLGVKT